MGLIIDPYKFVYGPVPTFQDDYTTNTGWTQVGTTITVNSGTAGKADGTSVPANADHRVHKALGVTLSNSLWYADFEFNITAVGEGAQGSIAWFSAGTGRMRDGSTDGLGVWIQRPGGTPQIGIVKADGATVGVSTTQTLPLSTLFYCRFERTSTTNARLSVFTDSARTVHQTGSPINYTIDATITTLSIIQHTSDASGGSAATWSGTVDTMRVYDGISPP